MPANTKYPKETKKAFKKRMAKKGKGKAKANPFAKAASQ